MSEEIEYEPHFTLEEVIKEVNDFTNGTCSIGSIPLKINTLTGDDLIHTRNSTNKMERFKLVQSQIVDAVNNGEKVKQGNTILCNGNINVRLVKKEEKYLVIDLYKKVN